MAFRRRRRQTTLGEAAIRSNQLHPHIRAGTIVGTMTRLVTTRQQGTLAARAGPKEIPLSLPSRFYHTVETQTPPMVTISNAARGDEALVRNGRNNAQAFVHPRRDPPPPPRSSPLPPQTALHDSADNPPPFLSTQPRQRVHAHVTLSDAAALCPPPLDRDRDRRGGRPPNRSLTDTSRDAPTALACSSSFVTLRLSCEPAAVCRSASTTAADLPPMPLTKPPWDRDWPGPVLLATDRSRNTPRLSPNTEPPTLLPCPLVLPLDWKCGAGARSGRMCTVLGSWVLKRSSREPSRDTRVRDIRGWGALPLRRALHQRKRTPSRTQVVCGQPLMTQQCPMTAIKQAAIVNSPFGGAEQAHVAHTCMCTCTRQLTPASLAETPSRFFF